MNLPEDLVYSHAGHSGESFLLSNLTSSIAASVAPRARSQIYVTSSRRTAEGPNPGAS